MTTIYMITVDQGSPEYYPTKKDALGEARRIFAGSDGVEVEVTAEEIDTSIPIREFCCLLLSGAGWSTKSTPVLTLTPKD